MSNKTNKTKQQRPGSFGGGPAFARGGEKPKDFRKAFRFLMSYLRPHKVSILVILVLAIVSVVISIRAPKILGKALTELFRVVILRQTPLGNLGLRAEINYEYIFQILLTVGIIYAISALGDYFSQFIMAGISQKVVRTMREDINQKLKRMPIREYDRRPHGEFISRVTNDIDLISQTLQQGLLQFITGITLIIGTIYMMITINFWLTLIALSTIPLSAILTVVFAKKSQKYFREQQKLLGTITSQSEEVYSGLSVVKAYNKERDEIEKFEETSEKLAQVGTKAQFITGIIMPVMNFIGNLGYIFVAVFGAIFVTKDIIKIGDIQAFIQYSRQVNQPIVQIANVVNLIQSTLAASERVNEILNETEQEEKDKKDAIELEQVKGKVDFENVKFGYTRDKILFENLTINVKPGQKIAIVGPTGAGKTTLVNLLMRFYDIHDGNIKLDDIDIRDYKKNNLRRKMGMVLQDAWVFSGTIYDNIRYGRLDAIEEDVYQATKEAYAHHFIMALPNGYNTIINEDATNISQGQKQLITIARAFLTKPQILILDEATSNVDTLTEKYIQKATEKLMKDKTSFIIAHRLSTIRDADIIFVMNEGKIIEIGTHKELLEKRGFYFDLYRSQFMGALVEA